MYFRILPDLTHGFLTNVPTKKSGGLVRAPRGRMLGFLLSISVVEWLGLGVALRFRLF